MVIREFRGKHRFLSNFWPAYVKLGDIWFNSVEHAYVAAKTLNLGLREDISLMEEPKDVKNFGRTFKVRPDWEQVKYEIMLDLVRQKFWTSTLLSAALVQTGDALLEEGNTWHDNYWGICRCDKCKGKGLNNLGIILMIVREEIKLGEIKRR